MPRVHARGVARPRCRPPPCSCSTRSAAAATTRTTRDLIRAPRGGSLMALLPLPPGPPLTRARDRSAPRRRKAPTRRRRRGGGINSTRWRHGSMLCRTAAGCAYLPTAAEPLRVGLEQVVDAVVAVAPTGTRRSHRSWARAGSASSSAAAAAATAAIARSLLAARAARPGRRLDQLGSRRLDLVRRVGR